MTSTDLHNLGYEVIGGKAVKRTGECASPQKNRFIRFIAAPVKSEINSREHWAVKRERRIEQQRAIMREFGSFIAGRGKPRLVVFFLLSSQQIDDDNLRSCCKSYRDSIAKLCGFNDREGAWRYDQRKPSSYESRGTWIVVQFDRSTKPMRAKGGERRWKLTERFCGC